MTNNTKRVFKGYSELSLEEKRNFINKVQKLNEQETPTQRRRFMEKIDLGPTTDPCPCCGK